VVLIEVEQFKQALEHSARPTRKAGALAAKRIFAATIREMDIVGSYAPGCYALLLPTAGLADAVGVAERLRQVFSQCVPTGQATPAGQGGQLGPALSVGVVQVMESDDPVSLLKRAEAALASANRRGDNQAYYHDGHDCAPTTVILETMSAVRERSKE